MVSGDVSTDVRVHDTIFESDRMIDTDAFKFKNICINLVESEIYANIQCIGVMTSCANVLTFRGQHPRVKQTVEAAFTVCHYSGY